MVRHWTINGRFLAQPVTGVQRYAREITREIDLQLAARARLTEGLTVELLVPPDARELLPLSNIGVRTIGRAGGHLWEQAVLPSNVKGGLLCLCNTGPLAIRKQILCIHDVNTRTYPQSYSATFRLLYRLLLPLLGWRAMQLTTVSQYSAGELKLHGIAEGRNVVIAVDGHEHALRWKPDRSDRIKAVAGARTIVVLGSAAPHKNVRLILEMSSRLGGAGFTVAVVGASDARVFGTIDMKAADNVVWLGRITDAELSALLQDSLCLAFPSFVEGFGLPVLEAIATGCAVVASDRASLPEIGGDAVLYAPPDQADRWFDHFVKLRDDPELRADLVERGREQASRFQWRTSAERYLELMSRADGHHP